MPRRLGCKYITRPVPIAAATGKNHIGASDLVGTLEHCVIPALPSRLELNNYSVASAQVAMKVKTSAK